jgi:hypothetical protein
MEQDENCRLPSENPQGSKEWFMGSFSRGTLGNVHRKSLTLLERENDQKVKKLFAFYAIVAHGACNVVGLALVFLIGFHPGGFTLPTDFMRWVLPTIIGGQAGLVGLVYRFYYRQEASPARKRNTKIV